jgi:hypothetical protein
MTPDHLGYVAFFLNIDDPRPAREQFDTAYRHGGGWSPFKGHAMLPNGNLKYPGDPPTRLLAETRLRDEVIRFYEHSWIAIVQPDGGYEIARLD